MSERVVSVGPDDTVRSVLAAMAKHSIHEVPVVADGKLVGWISYDDLMQRGSINNDAHARTVQSKPPRLSADDDVVTAAEKLVSSQRGALPVVDQNEAVVGILSRTDLIEAAVAHPDVATQPLAKVMTQDLETINESETVDAAEHRLRRLHINQLLVLDKGGKLAGYLSTESVTQTLHAEKDKETSGGSNGNQARGPGQRKDRQLLAQGLTKQAPTLSPSATLKDAVASMREAGTNFVAVVEDGYPVGIVSRADILLRLSAQKPQEDGVLVQISGLGDDVESSVFDRIYSRAQQTLKKIQDEYRIEYLAFHVKTQRPKGEGDQVHQVTAHLSTEREFVVVKGEDWEVLAATDQAMDALERRARDKKERRLDKRKNAGRRAAAQL